MTVKADSQVFEEAPRRGRGLVWLALALVLLLGAWAVYRFVLNRSEGPEYELEEVKRGDVTARVSATGTLEALTTVTVGSQVSGPVLQLLVDFNSEVTAGQVLAVLDPSAFQARVSQFQAALDGANASLNNATAQLANADAGMAQAQAQVDSARAQLEQSRSQIDTALAAEENAQAGVLRAQAEMEQALAEYRRYEELAKRELISQSDVDQRRTAYKVSEAAYQTAMAGRREARAGSTQARSRVDVSRGELHAAQTRAHAAAAQRRAAEAQVRSAQAQVRQAQANVDQAVVDLERTTIRSPINGTVISRKVDVGQTVAAAFQAPELFKIAQDLHQMQVRVEVSEADIGQLRKGQRVEFKVDAFPGRTFEGEVTQVRVGPVEQTEQQRQNVVVYGVLVSAPNPELLLRPGMTATVDISIETRKNVLVIPGKATLFIPPETPSSSPSPGQSPGKQREKRDKDKKPREGRAAAVWVPGPKGPESRDIRTGVTDGDLVEVLSGDLKEGEKVIVGEAGEDKPDGKSSPSNRRRTRMFF
ncbi:MAG: efflux RND transporter periplasmic adaptor subunit [Candidatus Eremiobacterota bacterium]